MADNPLFLFAALSLIYSRNCRRTRSDSELIYNSERREILKQFFFVICRRSA